MAIPVVVDFAVELSGIYPSASVVELQQFYCNRYGITDENFAYWLRDAKPEVTKAYTGHIGETQRKNAGEIEYGVLVPVWD